MSGLNVGLLRYQTEDTIVSLCVHVYIYTYMYAQQTPFVTSESVSRIQ
jgi:hypothetical protein